MPGLNAVCKLPIRIVLAHIVSKPVRNLEMPEGFRVKTCDPVTLKLNNMPKKTDANHIAISDAFRRLGYSVKSMHEVGGGFPDLVVAKGSDTYLVEIKTAAGKLNELQQAFIDKWNGKVYVVHCVDDVLAFNSDLLAPVEPNRKYFVKDFKNNTIQTL